MSQQLHILYAQDIKQHIKHDAAQKKKEKLNRVSQWKLSTYSPHSAVSHCHSVELY